MALFYFLLGVLLFRSGHVRVYNLWLIPYAVFGAADVDVAAVLSLSRPAHRLHRARSATQNCGLHRRAQLRLPARHPPPPPIAAVSLVVDTPPPDHPGGLRAPGTTSARHPPIEHDNRPRALRLDLGSGTRVESHAAHACAGTSCHGPPTPGFRARSAPARPWALAFAHMA